MDYLKARTMMTNSEISCIIVYQGKKKTSRQVLFDASRFTVLGDRDEVEIEPPSSLSLTRGGRESKPPIKYHNIEWQTVLGRGKRGRSSYH
ncbi:unnamed protein product [Brassica napus]|uniref:(rape) hypothetical protein n=1 Tax=Brassica napus TaxID=3708 RepID=A0A816Z302_BRANA|nr:unnamed protein product [Brassica napus]